MNGSTSPVLTSRAPARVLPFRSPRFHAGRISSFDLVEAFWRAREVLPYDVFQKLTSAMKATAFSTALNFDLDLLKGVMEDLEQVRADGGDVKDFRDAMKDTLDDFGASIDDVPADRLQLIYQQETTTAANGGLYGEMFSPDGMAAAEVWEFHCAQKTIDKDPEEMCAVLNGKLFWKDDPSSYQYLPQIHFRCRCYVISRAYEEGMEIWTGLQIDGSPDEGFNYNKLAPLTGTYGALGQWAA